ncbi:hypothetical protein [Acidiluteibacter ferrifornacis]|uniref:Uncharacterized protein n=1 Tax=Acidiluteibacter ferrifornacis TaxID=2692424 RepID=A0A6N9NMG9_9FLAO|nr:hypothetical protein [Acidiluteibacter ferrifornacis]MBR9831257.1 hypothetical protein [bacterium]NBG67082.1 hypothetical protein [Acidiluteibacter ferrifornacis]
MFILDPKGEVPHIFHSDLTGAAIQACALCNTDLSDDIDYIIEKAFKKAGTGMVHTIFEYALCFECIPIMQARMSEESKKNITEFFESKVNLEKRFQEMIEENQLEAEKWLNHCVVTNKSIDDLDEYQIYGQFKGNRLVFGLFPYTISGEVLDQIIHLISAKSLDEMNGFKDQIITPDPTLKELFPTNRPPILI